MSDNEKELPKIRVWKKDEMSKRIAFFKDFEVNNPLCNALFGPILSSLSVPLTPSP